MRAQRARVRFCCCASSAAAVERSSSSRNALMRALLLLLLSAEARAASGTAVPEGPEAALIVPVGASSLNSSSSRSTRALANWHY